MKKIVSSVVVLGLCSYINAQTINVSNGWQLVGSSEDLNVSKFDSTCVDYLWKYDNSSSTALWQLHVSNGNDYGYTGVMITDLKEGEGFWLKGNANAPCTVNTANALPTPPETPTLSLSEDDFIGKIYTFNSTDPVNVTFNSGYTFTSTGDGDTSGSWSLTGDSITIVDNYGTTTFAFMSNSLVDITSQDTGGTPSTTTGLSYSVVDIQTTNITITHKEITYETVTSPFTGEVWLDRNLGASQVCTSLDDTSCYGDYYQWGRNADGHQLTSSALTYNTTSSINPIESDFVRGNIDWTTADNDGALRSANWNMTDGTNICPVGFRVPTDIELKAETIDASTVITNNTTAFESFLKLPSAGYRDYSNGPMTEQGTYGRYWSSTPNNGAMYSDYETTAKALIFKTTGSASIKSSFTFRPFGYSVRCIKDSGTF